MSAPRGPQPGDQPGAEHDPTMDALLEYLAATALAPAPDLASRIQVRIAQEPDRTPTRRFLLALVHLRLATALGAFRQLVRVAGGGGNFPALLRAQALGLVLVTTLSAVALGVGAAVSVQRVISERRGPVPTDPAPTVPSRTTGPTLAPIASAPPTDDLGSPTPSPQADAPLTHPTPTPDPAAQADRPGKTQKPERGSSTTAHPTPRPQPTKTPRPTKTTRPQPTKTPRPGRTPHPTERPERTDRPEPTETPEPEDGGGHGGGDGAGETDKPDDGTVWSGVVMAERLVPPSWAFPPEGPA